MTPEIKALKALHTKIKAEVWSNEKGKCSVLTGIEMAIGRLLTLHAKESDK